MKGIQKTTCIARQHTDARYWYSNSGIVFNVCLGVYVCVCVCVCVSAIQHELSYRKQIARQLRTQYIEGIYINAVTLKCRLRVTQGHWKRNYWIDHTWLTISLVIWHWIISWPWNLAQRSPKVIEIGVIRKHGCGFLFAFYSNCGRICSRLWDIQRQRLVWPWKQG